LTRILACLLPPAPHGPFACRRPFPEVCGPTALSEVDSDQHQLCLAWLRYALRLSQPLDASFRPRPVWPCFVPVTLLGLVSQRIPLPDSGACLTPPPCDVGFTTHTSLRAVSPGRSYPKIIGAVLNAASRVCALGESVLRGPVLSGGHRPFLSQTCLSEVSSLRPWLRASTVPPLMGFGTPPDGCPPVFVPALQSVNEPKG
jgi:hypothetical protein